MSATLAPRSRFIWSVLIDMELILSLLSSRSPIIDIVFEGNNVLTGAGNFTIRFQGDGKSVTGAAPIIQELCAYFPFLAGKDSKAEKLWISQLESFQTLDFKTLDPVLQRLNTHLILRSFITGHSLSTADITIWGALRGNRVAVAALKKGTLVNLTRWYKFIEELCPWAMLAVESLNATTREKKLAKAKDGANYDIALKVSLEVFCLSDNKQLTRGIIENTENGVVTRFPPEPSGYLHIGHAKAALLEFQDAILEDLALMGIHPDKVSYTSDYFDHLHDYCVRIIQSGNAYADDTDKVTMKDQRWDGLPSQHRDLCPDESLAHFAEMKKGTPEGLRWCIRAKISVDDTNKAMRDPVIYRCNPAHHHRTCDSWVIYPTYDFACPIVDSIEGVTHALRSIEYRDRNPQYQWMLDTLGLRTVQVWDFARMNFIRTLLSKRKLTKLVESGVVWGWDDPRFPTVRGIRRRGMTIPALREFILKQGPSKNVTLFDWALIWATNKKHIDPIASRYTAIETEDCVEATVTGGPVTPYTEKRQKHAKNTALGEKDVAFSSSVILEQVDAQSFQENEEITLMNWGNVIVRKIATNLSTGKVTHLELELHLAGDVKKTNKKVTWLSTEGHSLVPIELVDFDYLLKKDSLNKEHVLEEFLNFNTEFRVDALAESSVSNVQVGDIIHFDRKGFYRVDQAPAAGVPGIFFNIPTGKQK
ncbi:unnamed protein product [Penicillium olsonii]|nr:unnamed protein product [Penicillium olsonii]